MVVQSNISISKASQYVHTTEQDNISFDAQGGAYHNLTITLDYKQTGPVYGFDTYADYIRVYAPANAQLQGGNGFDRTLLNSTVKQDGSTGTYVCNSKPPNLQWKWGSTSRDWHQPVAQYASSLPSDARYCPNGNYSLGLRDWGVTGLVDSLVPPTEVTSDLTRTSHVGWVDVDTEELYINNHASMVCSAMLLSIFRVSPLFDSGAEARWVYSYYSDHC